MSSTIRVPLLVAAVAAPCAFGAVVPFVAQSTPAGLAPDQIAWDLRILVTENDALPRFNLDARISEGRFFDPVPQQQIFRMGGTLADTFFAGSSSAPNGPDSSILPGFTVQPVFSSTRVAGGILDGAASGNGDYLITRFIASQDAAFEITLFLSSALNPSGRTEVLVVPAAPTVVVPALALGLALRRRR